MASQKGTDLIRNYKRETSEKVVRLAPVAERFRDQMQVHDEAMRRGRAMGFPPLAVKQTLIACDYNLARTIRCLNAEARCEPDAMRRALRDFPEPDEAA